MRVSSRKRGFTLTELMIVIAIISILVATASVNVVRSRARGQYTGCITNLKHLGTALQMYANDSAQRFPTTLTGLTPNFMKVIPTCPSTAGSFPYDSGYASASNPDAYTLVCSSASGNHAGLGFGANFPQYTYNRGLLEK